MVNVLEAQLEAFFSKRIRLAGGYTIKLAPTTAGVPDRLVFFPQRTYLVELKAANGQLSPVQIAWHQNLLKRWGIHVHTLYGAEGIKEWIGDVVDSYTPPSS